MYYTQAPFCNAKKLDEHYHNFDCSYIMYAPIKTVHEEVYNLVIYACFNKRPL